MSGVFGQPRNLIRPRFWSMLADLVRFYRQAPLDTELIDDEQISLGDYLVNEARYGECLSRRSSAADGERDLVGSRRPKCCRIQPRPLSVSTTTTACCSSRQRPAWETVVGGSRNYVERLTRSIADRIRLDTGVQRSASHERWRHRY